MAMATPQMRKMDQPKKPPSLTKAAAELRIDAPSMVESPYEVFFFYSILIAYHDLKKKKDAKKRKWLSIMLRKELPFNSFNKDMDDFNMNFLNPVSNMTFYNEGEVTKLFEFTSRFTQ